MTPINTFHRLINRGIVEGGKVKEDFKNIILKKKKREREMN